MLTGPRGDAFRILGASLDGYTCSLPAPVAVNPPTPPLAISAAVDGVPGRGDG